MYWWWSQETHLCLNIWEFTSFMIRCRICYWWKHGRQFKCDSKCCCCCCNHIRPGFIRFMYEKYFALNRHAVYVYFARIHTNNDDTSNEKYENYLSWISHTSIHTHIHQMCDWFAQTVYPLYLRWFFIIIFHVIYFVQKEIRISYGSTNKVIR